MGSEIVTIQDNPAQSLEIQSLQELQQTNSEDATWRQEVLTLKHSRFCPFPWNSQRLQ